MRIDTRQLVPDLWAEVEALFEPVNGCDGCWCVNHHIPPGAPDIRNAAAKAELRRLVEAGQANGVLAFVDGEVAGWCAVDRRADIPGHDCTLPFEPEPGADVWSIHCFFVTGAHRGNGVAHALLDRAVEMARDRGGTHLEAYPTLPNDEGRIYDFSGPYRMFEARGFELVEDLGPDYSRMVKRL